MGLGYTLTKTDKRVLDAFTSGLPASSKTFTSHGMTLDGNYVGGSGIAQWHGGKLYLRPPMGNVSQTIFNYLKKTTPKNLIGGYTDGQPIRNPSSEAAPTIGALKSALRHAGYDNSQIAPYQRGAIEITSPGSQWWEVLVYLRNGQFFLTNQGSTDKLYTSSIPQAVSFTLRHAKPKSRNPSSGAKQRARGTRDIYAMAYGNEFGGWKTGRSVKGQRHSAWINEAESARRRGNKIAHERALSAAGDNRPALPNPARGPRGEVDQHAAHDLHLTIANDGQLYTQQYMPIVENLRKKLAKGTYDRTKAVKLVMYLVDNGAKKYTRQFGTTFNVPTRMAAAAMLLADMEENYLGL
jgi:hypothetical protein